MINKAVTKKISILLFVFISIFSFGQAPKIIYKTIGGKAIYNIESKNVFILTSGFMVDADGSPKAYNKDNDIALDYLANAGKPHNWWALATDKLRNPIVQTKDDPAPGYYVSMTSLQDKRQDYKHPARYVNSELIPYIVIPSHFSKDFKTGDIALVINTKNNKRCFAICADIGPVNKIGEGSIYLAEQLNIRSNPKKGGCSSGVIYILIKNSGTGTTLGKAEIEKTGKIKLSEDDILELIESSK